MSVIMYWTGERLAGSGQEGRPRNYKFQHLVVVGL